MTAVEGALERAADRLGLCREACRIETVTVAVADGVRTITVYCGEHGLKSVSLPTRLAR